MSLGRHRFLGYPVYGFQSVHAGINSGSVAGHLFFGPATDTISPAMSSLRLLFLTKFTKKCKHIDTREKEYL